MTKSYATEQQERRESKEKARKVARKILTNPQNYCFWDTETTGLDTEAQIIEVSAIDGAGNVLINQRVRPTVAINPQAQAVHGIDIKDLASAPTWLEIVNDWESVIADRIMVAYNAPFDVRVLDQTYKNFQLTRQPIKGMCLMDLATRWRGRKEKLGGSHSALGDCYKCLELTRTIANHHVPVTDVIEVVNLDAILEDMGLQTPLPWPADFLD